mmetsp:Transcript_33294/g.80849  ORF Transcript_33294/g.80849 Transcript_33294/m.80849 type:complete len:101 (+) Transcript_33294:409-711(+)
MTMQVRWLPSFRIAFCTFCSVTLSSDEVASSRRTIGGSFNKQRAMATRCFSPPESLSPLSPTAVSHSSGSRSMKSYICAALHASTTSSLVLFRLPYRTLW